MRTALLACLVSALLAACAEQTATITSPAGPLNGVYDCSLTGQADGNAAAATRIVTLRGDPDGKRLALDIVEGHDEVLDPVPGAAGKLFANQLFAWRVGSASGVLTDVERIATYSCQRAGEVPATGSTGGG